MNEIRGLEVKLEYHLKVFDILINLNNNEKDMMKMIQELSCMASGTSLNTKDCSKLDAEIEYLNQSVELAFNQENMHGDIQGNDKLSVSSWTIHRNKMDRGELQHKAAFQLLKVMDIYNRLAQKAAEGPSSAHDNQAIPKLSVPAVQNKSEGLRLCDFPFPPQRPSGTPRYKPHRQSSLRRTSSVPWKLSVTPLSDDLDGDRATNNAKVAQQGNQRQKPSRHFLGASSNDSEPRSVFRSCSPRSRKAHPKVVTLHRSNRRLHKPQRQFGLINTDTKKSGIVIRSDSQQQSQLDNSDDSSWQFSCRRQKMAFIHISHAVLLAHRLNQLVTKFSEQSVEQAVSARIDELSALVGSDPSLLETPPMNISGQRSKSVSPKHSNRQVPQICIITQPMNAQLGITLTRKKNTVLIYKIHTEKAPKDVQEKLNVGDKLLSLNGTKYSTVKEFVNGIKSIEVGQPLVFTVLHGQKNKHKKSKSLTVKVCKPINGVMGLTISRKDEIIYIKDIDQSKAPPDVRSRLEVGDQIKAMNSIRYASAGALFAAIDEVNAGDDLVFKIERSAETMIYHLKTTVDEERKSNQQLKMENDFLLHKILFMEQQLAIAKNDSNEYSKKKVLEHEHQGKGYNFDQDRAFQKFIFLPKAQEESSQTSNSIPLTNSGFMNPGMEGSLGSDSTPFQEEILAFKDALSSIHSTVHELEMAQTTECLAEDMTLDSLAMSVQNAIQMLENVETDGSILDLDGVISPIQCAVHELEAAEIDLPPMDVVISSIQNTICELEAVQTDMPPLDTVVCSIQCTVEELEAVEALPFLANNLTLDILIASLENAVGELENTRTGALLEDSLANEMSDSLQKEDSKVIYQNQHQATLQLQSWWRSQIVQKWYANYSSKVKILSATKIQALWRAKRVRTVYRFTKKVKTLSATKIQASWRAKRERASYKFTRKVRRSSATTIQVWWRAKSTDCPTKVQRSSATTIQLWWRAKSTDCPTKDNEASDGIQKREMENLVASEDFTLTKEDSSVDSSTSTQLCDNEALLEERRCVEKTAMGRQGPGKHLKEIDTTRNEDHTSVEKRSPVKNLIAMFNRKSPGGSGSQSPRQFTPKPTTPKPSSSWAFCKQQNKCPGGHRLEEVGNPGAFHVCSYCRTLMNQQQAHYACQICKFHVCAACDADVERLSHDPEEEESHEQSKQVDCPMEHGLEYILQWPGYPCDTCAEQQPECKGCLECNFFVCSSCEQEEGLILVQKKGER